MTFRLLALLMAYYLTLPANAGPISARVEMRAGAPRLILNGEQTQPLLYALTDAPGSRWSWEEVPSRNISLFAQQGVRLFQADIWFEQMIGPDDVLDITLARKQIAGVLAAAGNRNVAVMLRLHLNAPPWWCVRNPDECVGYADGTIPAPEKRWGLERLLGRDLDAQQRASFYSEKWRAWARRHIAEFCKQLAATPEGDSVFSIQVANGVYGEWHQFGFVKHDPDNGPAATAAFQSWLRVRYPAPDTLAFAWSQKNLTPEAAAIPDRASRAIADLGTVRDPVLRRPVIDYYTFLHEGLADTIIMMAETVKANWPRPIVTSTFYGYFYGMFGRHAEGGHLAFSRLLASPAIDCICATPSYDDATRGFGATGHGRVFSSAILRSGKLWIEEMDAATAVGGCPWDKKITSTIPDDIAMLRRNLLQSAVRGGGAWLYDFGMLGTQANFALQGVNGWWDEPRLQAELTQLFNLMRAREKTPFTRAADVLVIHDPWSFANTVSLRENAVGIDGKKLRADPLTPLALDGLMEGLMHSGLIHDDALLSELPALDLAQYRLVIFATTPVLTNAQRDFIKEKIARDGRHVVFLGYCGWSDGKVLAAENETPLIGARTSSRQLKDTRTTFVLDGIRERADFKQPADVPVFWMPDEEANVERIGHWDADAEAVSAMCVTLPKMNGGASLWAFGIPPNSPDFLRALGRRADCRVLNDKNDTTFLGNGLLVVHTVSGGKRALRLPDGRAIETELAPRSTAVFDTATGAVILK